LELLSKGKGALLTLLNLRDINYAARLWQVFKAIIRGALNELKELLGFTVTLVIETIEKHINCFLIKKAIYVLLNGFYHQSDRIAEQSFQFI
jgi:hypothetical protein